MHCPGPLPVPQRFFELIDADLPPGHGCLHFPQVLLQQQVFVL
jgi:hypothetical protein